MAGSRRSSRLGPALKRRWFPIGAIALGTLLVASTVALVRPIQFRSDAAYRVQGVSAAGEADWAAQVESIRADLAAYRSFEVLVTELELDGDLEGLDHEVRERRRSALVESIQQRTTVTTAQTAPNAFDVAISYDGENPEDAYEIVEHMTRSLEGLVTSGPVQAQAAEVDRRAQALQRAVEETLQHQRARDEYAAENKRFLDGAEERVIAIRREISNLDSNELSALSTEIEKLTLLLRDEPASKVEMVEVRDDDRIDVLREELRGQEDQLRALLQDEDAAEDDARVTGKRDLIERITTALRTAEESVTLEERKTPNPMYVTLHEQRAAKEAALALSRRKLKLLQEQEAQAADELAAAPQVRAEFAKLDDAVTMASLEEATRREKHETALEFLRQLERQPQLTLETITTAGLPDSPVGLSPVALALAGLLAGVLAGIGFAFFADRMDRSFRSTGDAALYLGLPILGALDAVHTPLEAETRRRKHTRRSMTLTVLGFLSAAALAASLLGHGATLRGLVESVIG